MTALATLDQPRSTSIDAWHKAFLSSEQQDVKELAAYLCKAHSQQKIGDETFKLLLECLLSFYVEKQIEERLLARSDAFGRRILRYVKGMGLFE